MFTADNSQLREKSSKHTDSKNYTKIHKVTSLILQKLFFKKRVACTSFALQKRKFLNDAIHKVQEPRLSGEKSCKTADCGR